MSWFNFRDIQWFAEQDPGNKYKTEPWLNGVGDNFVRYPYFRFIKTRRTFNNVSLNENQHEYEMTSEINKTYNYFPHVLVVVSSRKYIK